MRGLLNWLETRLPLAGFCKRHFINYYVPQNLNFLYLLGSIALVILANQLLTGLWLTMFYTPNTKLAFSSIEYIMRDVNFGWLLRYMHSTGASAFFIIIYLHMFRGILYGSYQKPRELVWILGMFIFLLLLVEAFLGYLLPWGQMSYWGAEVITSLFGAIPYVGKNLVLWLRGGFSVGNPTLLRFFSMHVIAVPLLMIFLVFLHITALRQVGSNNPEGIEIYETLDENNKPKDGIPFHPYYTIKDTMGVIGFLVVFFAIVFFTPEMGGYFLEHSNFIIANPLITPDDITPLWYMAPFYSILRAIPNKLLGIGCLGLSLLVLFLLPWFDHSPVRSIRYKGIISKISVLFFIASVLLLGYLGTLRVNPTRLFLARVSTIIYFTYFLFMPFYSRLERCLPVPKRIGRR